MKIKSIKSYIADLSLTKAYEIAFQYTDKVENAFLEIELENGITGIGSAAPSAHVIGKTIDDLKRNLSNVQLQSWLGEDIRHFRSLRYQAMSIMGDDTSSLTAIDVALHDAYAKYLEIPVYKLYGQKIAPLQTSVTIGILDITETLKEAKEYIDMGFHVLKVKTGKQLDEDIERCIKLREIYGNKIVIRVDGNQGYNYQDTIDFYNRTLAHNIELIEQPMKVGSEEKMKTLPDEVRKVIACDESLKNPTSAMQLLSETPACGIFNIKLMKCGGLTGAFEISTIATASGTALFWGCYDESRASISAALHAALVCKNTKYLDLDGALFLDNDLVRGGYTFDQGMMYPTESAGFGCELL